MPEADVGVDERDNAAARSEGRERGGAEVWGGEVVPDGKRASDVGTTVEFEWAAEEDEVKGSPSGREGDMLSGEGVSARSKGLLVAEEGAGERCLRGVKESGWS